LTPNPDRTQLIPRPLWENPRVHLLNDIWLLTIVAVLIGTGVPWLASGFEVNIGTASWGLLALGGIHLAFTFLASPMRPRAGWHAHAMTMLEMAGIVLLGFIWEHVGALQNPMFLMIFALPVIGAIFLSRWHPYLLAALSILVVGIVSMGQAPELRWYASALLGGDTWLTWLFGREGTAAQPSFSAFYAPSNYLIVLLEVFTVGLIACTVAAEYLGLIFERLNAHTAIARREAERGQELWASLIERLPLPALLIDPASLRVVAASEVAVAYLRGEDVALEGRNLFDVLKFSYPDIVHELIVGSDGEAPSIVVRVADDLRVTRARVLHVMHKSRRLALLTVEDATEIFCVRAALDTSEYAALVVDARGRILAFNKLAVGLLGTAEVGMDAAKMLPQSDSGLRWWEPGLTGRRKMHMEIGPRIYQLTSSAIALPGEEESIFAVSFLPVAGGIASDPSGTNSTLITGTLRQLR